MSDYLGLSCFLFAVSPNPMKISVVSDPLDGTSARYSGLYALVILLVS
jgi:hypothetical protein